MDVDKMFKLPALPASAGQKRKFNDAPSPEMLKKYRNAEPEAMAAPTIPSSNGKTRVKAPTVTDEDKEDEGYARADTSVEEGGDPDEEGRFFGGGLNTEQRQIMDIFDAATDEEGEGASLSLPGFRRQLGRFERMVAKNAEQRGKFPDDPAK
ncbi:MAG: hypothetical protein TREMPRED_000856 [Tremellales sp. Tagirdzhanova-0007]|nr:MAG: hypothetical protein TREMPRED_000856 [Tremellales sp. Tagirdzhanova-0007]